MVGNKFSISLTLSEALLLLIYLTSSQDVGAKETSSNTNQQQQPLAALDKVLKQANGVKMDAITDPKLASNVTNALNEMALNLGKMLTENRRLSSQVQDVLQKVQSATGVNATTTLGNIQKQASNSSNLSNMSNMNLNSLISRFQVPQQKGQ